MPEKRKICLVYGLPDQLPATDDIYAVLWRYKAPDSEQHAIAVQIVSRAPFNKPVNPKLTVPMEIAFAILPSQYVGRWRAGQLITELLELNGAELSLEGLLDKEAIVRDWDEGLATQYLGAVMGPPASEDLPKIPWNMLAKYT